MIYTGQIYTLDAENISEIAAKIEETLQNKKFSFSSVSVRNGKLVEHHLSTNLSNSVGVWNQKEYISLSVNTGVFVLNLGVQISFYPDGITWSRKSETEVTQTRVLLHFA